MSLCFATVLMMMRRVGRGTHDGLFLGGLSVVAVAHFEVIVDVTFQKHLRPESLPATVDYALKRLIVPVVGYHVLLQPRPRAGTSSVNLKHDIVISKLYFTISFFFGIEVTERHKTTEIPFPMIFCCGIHWFNSVETLLISLLNK